MKKIDLDTVSNPLEYLIELFKDYDASRGLMDWKAVREMAQRSQQVVDDIRYRLRMVKGCHDQGLEARHRLDALYDFLATLLGYGTPSDEEKRSMATRPAARTKMGSQRPGRPISFESGHPVQDGAELCDCNTQDWPCVDKNGEPIPHEERQRLKKEGIKTPASYLPPTSGATHRFIQAIQSYLGYSHLPGQNEWPELYQQLAWFVDETRRRLTDLERLQQDGALYGLATRKQFHDVVKKLVEVGYLPSLTLKNLQEEQLGVRKSDTPPAPGWPLGAPSWAAPQPQVAQEPPSSPQATWGRLVAAEKPRGSNPAAIARRALWSVLNDCGLPRLTLEHQQRLMGLFLQVVGEELTECVKVLHLADRTAPTTFKLGLGLAIETLLKRSQPDSFQVGCTYEHTTGKRMKVLGVLDTRLYGPGTLIAEQDGALVPVGKDKPSTMNWFLVSEPDEKKKEDDKKEKKK